MQQCVQQPRFGWACLCVSLFQPFFQGQTEQGRVTYVRLVPRFFRFGFLVLRVVCSFRLSGRACTGLCVLFFPCVSQLQEARAEAEAAGEATRKDIEKLRGLHARRVRRLEALLKEEGENLADARREIGIVGISSLGNI